MKSLYKKQTREKLEFQRALKNKLAGAQLLNLTYRTMNKNQKFQKQEKFSYSFLCK